MGCSNFILSPGFLFIGSGRECAALDEDENARASLRSLFLRKQNAWPSNFSAWDIKRAGD
jgi:hypothetical protein